MFWPLLRYILLVVSSIALAKLGHYPPIVCADPTYSSKILEEIADNAEFIAER